MKREKKKMIYSCCKAKWDDKINKGRKNKSNFCVVDVLFDKNYLTRCSNLDQIKIIR